MTRFPSLKLEGGLIAADIVDQIADGAAQGQRPRDFGLERRHLTDEIAAVWAEARQHWKAFQHRLQNLPGDDPSATSTTRSQWVIPLLGLLGYDLTYMPRAAVVDGRSFAISHRAGPDESHPPVHIVSCLQSLDRRPESGRPRLAPHSLLQEYLNRTEHLWGVVTNGYTLRLLRDSQLMSRSAYIEFDLKEMMEGERFSDFALFYRLVHRSRLPRTFEDAPDCWLERYHQLTIEQGGRVRDKLRDGVEEALKTFANGFLAHPRNRALRDEVESGRLSPEEFYKQLLRLIYRLLFLMVAEERNLITDDKTYLQHYSVSRLRRLAEVRSAYNDHDDLWLGFQTTLRLFRDERIGGELDIKPLDGGLFMSSSTSDLEELYLSNRDFLSGIWFLSMYREDERSPWRRINYSALDVEELGSVYESLLDFQPHFTRENGRLAFEFSYGTERKTTGSYYTPRELVQELIKSALVPVMEERLKEAKTPKEKEEKLLSIKVCDPACGSGHFLLAAARCLGRELAKVRTGEEEPSPEQVRLGVRDVITHCIYGVDKNPLAVDLCKVALWIEGHYKGKPLTFLDHRIKCGDSLVGVFDLKVLEEGIPDDAFKPVSGDDKGVASELKRRNKEERNHPSLPFPIDERLKKKFAEHAEDIRLLEVFSDDDIATINDKREYYEKVRGLGTDWFYDCEKCNLWVAPFFAELTERNKLKVPTSRVLWEFLDDHRRVRKDIIGYADSLSVLYRFFHWPLEFPNVFEEGGFDVVLCNPPWERIKLQEQEFFATRDPEIANAPNRAARQRLIRELPQKNPKLWEEYHKTLHAAESLSKFLRHSGRFPLTARGDINTYSVFAELFTQLIKPEGRAGVIVPTGIATDDTNKQFFASLVESSQLVSLYDFENREKLFPDVDSRYKFSLLTLCGARSKEDKPAEFLFFATNVRHLSDERRRFTLSDEDFRLINPNTRTCPIFRTRYDAELTKKIYRRVPVLVNEVKEDNPWGIRFLSMFHMANDSHLFRTKEELEREGFELVGNRFVRGDEVWLPLYEAKMIWQFDHRFGTYEGVRSRSSTHLPTPSPDQHADPTSLVQPWYWVSAEEVESRLEEWERKWLLGFRDVTNATNERTAIFSLLPRVGVGHKVPLMLFESELTSVHILCLLANVNSIVFDFITRQKVGGTSLGFFILRQLPILRPPKYTEDDLEFIIPRTLELIYTSWDTKPFADDVWHETDEELREAIRQQWEENAAVTGGHRWEPPDWAFRWPEIETDPSKGIPLPPFKWDEGRRALLRAELDAYYSKLYGLTEEELRYILDPADIFGEDYPGETFRVLKEKEIHLFGEYRTKRLVLEAWEMLDEILRSSKRPSVHLGHLRYNQAAFLAFLVDYHHRRDIPLGRTKAVKQFFFAQEAWDVPLGMEFQKEAAGPLSPEFYRVESLAKRQGWIEVEGSQDSISYEPGPRISVALEQSAKFVGDKLKAVHDMIEKFASFNATEIARWATVYMVWKDLTASGRLPTEEELIREIHRWKSPDTKGYDRRLLSLTIRDMLACGLIRCVKEE